MQRLSPFWLLLLAGLAAAQPPKLRVSDLRNYRGENFNFCLHALSNLFDSLEDERVQSVSLGGIEELGKLLIQSGWTEGDVAEVKNFMEIVKKARARRPLSEVVMKLNEVEVEDQIFICIVSKRCVIARGAEGRFIQPTVNYEVSDAFKEGMKEFKLPPGTTPRGIEAMYDAIQLTMQADTHRRLRALSFVATLHHEARHVFDTELMSEWIVANRKLINAGKTPSKLFTQYVRILDPGKTSETIVVQNCFEKAWLEPRAYQTSLQTQELIVLHKAPAADVANRRSYIDSLAPELRNLAYHDVVDLPGGKDLLADYKIDEATIFDLGPKLEREMRSTIRRAAREGEPSGN